MSRNSSSCRGVGFRFVGPRRTRESFIVVRNVAERDGSFSDADCHRFVRAARVRSCFHSSERAQRQNRDGYRTEQRMEMNWLCQGAGCPVRFSRHVTDEAGLLERERTTRTRQSWPYLASRRSREPAICLTCCLFSFRVFRNTLPFK